jgi:undecaprenyl-diphosphatase
MDYLYALLLGIVQGLTEWLPISSTGHLILTERLFGLDPDVFNLTFDAAIQLGTTAAVIFYFRARTCSTSSATATVPRSVSSARRS